MSKIGRNELCPCGSGLKYKKCCSIARYPDEIFYKDGLGNTIPSELAVIPICQWVSEPEKEYKVLGTGFFICTDGIVITAKHVIEENNEILPDLFSITFDSERKFFWQPFDYIHNHIYRHPISDLAVLRLHPRYHNITKEYWKNKILRIKTRQLSKGSFVSSFGYPEGTFAYSESRGLIRYPKESFRCGKIIEIYPKGVDSVMFPGPCYRTDFYIPHCASGGPVFDETGSVIGVNCASFEGIQVSHITMIKEILDIEVGNVITDNSNEVTHMTLREMAEKNYISLLD